MGRDPLRFKPVPGDFVVGIGGRGEEKRLKSGVRSSVDRVELNYQKMLEFSSLIRMLIVSTSNFRFFFSFLLSFFRNYKVENDVNIC